MVLSVFKWCWVCVKMVLSVCYIVLVYRWVDGLLAAQYVYKRLEEQQLAREWYHRDGRTPHTAGSRICRNYLPKNSKLKQLRQERQLSNKPSSSLCSNDPGVGSAGGSLDNVNFDPLESYVDIEIAPDSMEVTSRELHPFLLFPRLSTMSCSVMTLPATPQVTTPPLPVLTESIDLSSQSGPLLPHSQSCEPAFLCSCHAYQMVTIEWANGSDCRRPRSAGTSPKLSQSGRCCHHCKGQCSTLLKDSWPNYILQSCDLCYSNMYLHHVHVYISHVYILCMYMYVCMQTWCMCIYSI